MNPVTVRDAPLPLLLDLCKCCRCICPRRDKVDERDGEILTPYTRRDVYPHYPGLEASARSGCSLCGFLRESLLSVCNPQAHARDPNSTHPFWGEDGEDLALSLPWDRKIVLTVHFYFEKFNESAQDRVTAGSDASSSQLNGMVTSMWLLYRPVNGPVKDDKGQSWGPATIVFSSFDSLAATLHRRRRLPSATTLTADNVSMMKQWIEDCKNNHTSCAAPTTYWAPRRLLEISGARGSRRVRLVETAEEELRDCPFAALSHVWGDISVSPPLRTLKSNYDELTAGIKQAQLPKNFADAVEVCSELDIQYLWIDSLCIIQDSTEDWLDQFVFMHLVYRHALVTIVATKASSSHDGFLSRDIEQSRAIKIPYALYGEIGRSCDKDPYIILCRHESSFEGQRLHVVDGAQWNTRGWTMQERSLSTRALHFCRNKIFFECRECLKSEENEPAQEFELLGGTLWPRGGSRPAMELYRHWELLLNEYSRRNLTNARDKLPAIRSVAEEMVSATGMEYIEFAGMWRSYLQRELLWSVGFGKATKPQQTRAPSWSWAHIDGHINFIDSPLRGTKRTMPESLSEVLHRDPFQVLEVTDIDPGSGLDAIGFLKVRSLTRPISCIKTIEAAELWRSFFRLDLMASAPQTHGSGAESVFAYGRFDVEDQKLTGQLLYLHIGETSRITGLILEQVGNRSLPENGATVRFWRRVGVATLFGDLTGLLIDNAVSPEDFTTQALFII